MIKLRAYFLFLFTVSLFIALLSGPITVDIPVYILVFSIYLFFTSLYSHMNTVARTGKVNVDYSISYGLSFVLFTGPLGLFLFEIVNRFYVYFYRKRKDIADEDEFLHTFYNIAGPALLNILGYYVFYALYPYIQPVPFGMWILLIAIVLVNSILSSLLLLSIFKISKVINTRQEAINFIKSAELNRELKTAMSNGLLFLFLINGYWEALIVLFAMNYLVSKSATSHSQTMEHKMERDRFKRMAYTDHLTTLHNRTYMTSILNKLDASYQYLAIVVTDLDSFKRINDTYNHAVGDTVIQHFATHLKTFTNRTDYVFRTGGEEFTMILVNRTYEECEQFVENLRNNFQDSAHQAEYRMKQVKIDYTASFGMYYFQATEDISLREAYVAADELLLYAKRQGKDQLVSHDGTVQRDIPVAIFNEGN